MVAVCRMAPQAALPEQSLAVGHRHLARSTTRARRAWSPSIPAGTLQETTPGQWPAGDRPLVHRASSPGCSVTFAADASFLMAVSPFQ